MKTQLSSYKSLNMQCFVRLARYAPFDLIIKPPFDLRENITNFDMHGMKLVVTYYNNFSSCVLSIDLLLNIDFLLDALSSTNSIE